MEPNDFTTADAMADGGSDDGSLRGRIRAFIARHAVSWEVTFAALALIWVAFDFGFENAQGETATWVFAATVALNIVFAIEFFGRLWAAIDRPQHLRNHVVDGVALVPPFRILRLLRLFRLVRVFSGVYRAGMRWGPLAEHRGFLSLVVAWVVLGVLCSVAFYVAEAEANGSISDPLDALWWGVGSLTTVGSDLFPVTLEGRLAAMLLMLVGVFLFSAITATITSFLLSQGGTGDEDGPVSLSAEIDRLARLRDRGDLSAQEFAMAKGHVLGTSSTDGLGVAAPTSTVIQGLTADDDRDLVRGRALERILDTLRLVLVSAVWRPLSRRYRTIAVGHRRRGGRSNPPAA